MTLDDVLKGLQLSSYSHVVVIDAETDKYLKGGNVKDILGRFPDYCVVRTVVSHDGIIRFLVRN